MNRLGLLYPDELDEDGKKFYDSMEFYTRTKYQNPYVARAQRIFLPV